MKRYFLLVAEFFRISVIADLEFRANIAVKIATDLIWYFAQIVVFEVLYRYTPVIAGWTLPEVRVFMGILFFVDAVWMLLFRRQSPS
jgi:ABC-2 type transport system permease protein